MIKMQLKGGLGNQMFQYALGKQLAIKHGTELGLQISVEREIEIYLNTFFSKKYLNSHTKYALDIFNINAKKQCLFRLLRRFDCEKWIKRMGYKIIEENSFYYDPDIVQKTTKNTYLIGYWQSFLYFKDIEHILRKDFTFKAPIMAKSLPILQKIQTTTSVCIHVRRGDYLTKAENQKLHNTISDKAIYFTKSANYLANKIDTKWLHFFVFSDDIAWCIENIKLPYSTHFVSKDHSGKKAENHLQLMTKCKHFIISNSSFSWWAAWLSESRDKIVIAPKKWFNLKTFNTKDLTPPEWIRFE